MANIRTGLLALGVAASALFSTAAGASPAEIVPLLDTTAPKYNSPECQQAREVAANYATFGARYGAAEGMMSYYFGVFGILAMASAANEAAKAEAAFVRDFIVQCGEDAFIPYFRARAEKGDDNAAAWLGRTYAQKEDWEQAVHWYQAAVDRRNVPAQVGLGTLYAQGKGVTQDRARAAALWEKAAGHGSSEAQRYLGLMSVEDQNYAKAIELYADAGAHGDGIAAFNLAQMYEQGVGVARSDRMAFGWYSMAVLGLHPDALAKRGELAARLKQDVIDYEIRAVERCYYSRVCKF